MIALLDCLNRDHYSLRCKANCHTCIRCGEWKKLVVIIIKLATQEILREKYYLAYRYIDMDYDPIIYSDKIMRCEVSMHIFEAKNIYFIMTVTNYLMTQISIADTAYNYLIDGCNNDVKYIVI